MNLLETRLILERRERERKRERDVKFIEREREKT